MIKAAAHGIPHAPLAAAGPCLHVVPTRAPSSRPWFMTILGILLLLAYFVDLKRKLDIGTQTMQRRFLYLTHWNYLLITGFLLVFPVLTVHVRLSACAAVTTIALFVLIARLAFLKEDSLSLYDTSWDVLTHIIVPLVPVAVMLFASEPFPTDRLTPCMVGVGILEMWMAVNFAVQSTREDKKWVYGTAANPRTQTGRYQLLAAIALVVVCTVITMQLSRISSLAHAQQ